MCPNIMRAPLLKVQDKVRSATVPEQAWVTDTRTLGQRARIQIQACMYVHVFMYCAIPCSRGLAMGQPTPQPSSPTKCRKRVRKSVRKNLHKGKDIQCATALMLKNNICFTQQKYKMYWIISKYNKYIDRVNIFRRLSLNILQVNFKTLEYYEQ